MLKIKLPAFFPDATRGVIKTLDTKDIKNTKTKGLLVNTYHLYRDLGPNFFKKINGVKELMNWEGPVISDSGGFQIMSLVKTKGGLINDKGVLFQTKENQKILFTPKKSIQFQFMLKTDIMVVLDDFTSPQDDYHKAKQTVERTIKWAKIAKEEFENLCYKHKIKPKQRPLLTGVIQGGEFQDLRIQCINQLSEIGFDIYGFGGWPINKHGNFDYETATTIAKYTPKDTILYGLGIGKPEDIVGCVKLGFKIFDCVLPTRDARHGRLYIFNAKSTDKINPFKKDFYHFWDATKKIILPEDAKQPVSTACDCLLCTKYTKAYLKHLFRIKETSAQRLASIHNLRFYSLLMQKLQSETRPYPPRS